MMNEFQATEAFRLPQKLWVGCSGPTGSGKTLSAILVALGIQEIDPGDVFLLDSEQGRATHYAPTKGEKPDFKMTFPFKRVAFEPPYSPARYLQACEACVKQGAKTIIIDQATYFHDGPGGVLDWHADECERLAKKWNTGLDQANAAAWKVVKGDLKRIIFNLHRLPVNIIFLFRAQPKNEYKKGESPKALGMMPVSSKELWYEMDIMFLLQEGADGFPSFTPEGKGAKLASKCPIWARPMFASGNRQLNQSVGRDLAKWASGGKIAAGSSPLDAAPGSTPPSPPPSGRPPSAPATDEQGKRLWEATSKLGAAANRLAWISQKVERGVVDPVAELNFGQMEMLIELAKDL